MSSVDSPSYELAPSIERKRWETPVVIVASTQHSTRNYSTSAVDAIAPSGTPYGS